MNSDDNDVDWNRHDVNSDDTNESFGMTIVMILRRILLIVRCVPTIHKESSRYCEEPRTNFTQRVPTLLAIVPTLPITLPTLLTAILLYLLLFVLYSPELLL
jgi:hypothetical protein